MFYHFGMSRYNPSLFGWGGHTGEVVRVYADPSVLEEKLALWRNLSDIVSYVVTLESSFWRIMNDIKLINLMVETTKQFY